MADISKSLSKIPLIGQSLFGENPQINTVDLDQGTKDLIHQDVTRSANETPGDIQNQITGSAVSANNQLNIMDPNQQAAGSGQDPHMIAAIQNRYRQMNQFDLGKFKNQSDLQARMMKGERMSSFAQAALAQQQVQTNNYAMLSQAYQQNEMARAQVIDNIVQGGEQMYGMSKGRSGPSSPQANSSLQQFNASGSNFAGDNPNAFEGYA